MKTLKFLFSKSYSFYSFLFFEALNGYCHLKLKALRPKGSTEHLLPRGLFFDSITCPNYTFEILSWFSFYLFTRVFASLLFTIFGLAQMFIWAEKKTEQVNFSI